MLNSRRLRSLLGKWGGEARGFTSEEQGEALALLTDMEKLSVLGTTAGSLDRRDHDCERGGEWFPGSLQCRLCGKGMDAPPHSCLSVEIPAYQTTGYRAPRWVPTELRCKICNREMK